MKVEVPSGWTQWGDVPDFDPIAEDLTRVRRLALTEDIWVAEGPERQVTIHVGWYPSCDPTGSFAAKVVQGGDWEFPVEQIATKSTRLLTGWLVETLEWCSRFAAIRVPRAERRRDVRSSSRRGRIPLQPPEIMTGAMPLQVPPGSSTTELTSLPPMMHSGIADAA